MPVILNVEGNVFQLEFDWAKAKNGAVKAVFALVCVKLAVNGVVSALVFGKWGGARALWGLKTRV